MQAHTQAKLFNRVVFNPFKSVMWTYLFSSIMLAAAMVFSILALQTSQPETAQLQSISFKVAEAQGPEQLLTESETKLQGQPLKEEFSNRLHHQWYWLEIPVDRKESTGLDRLVFNSRHLIGANCQSGAVAFNGQYWTAELAKVSGSSLLCMVQMVGPGSLTIELTAQKVLEEKRLLELEKMSFLQGSFLSLMMLAALSALVSRKPVFLVYAIWLFASLRVCLISSGLDSYLFGMSLPVALLPETRALSLSAYFITTFCLALALFPNSSFPMWKPCRHTVLVGAFCLFGFAMFGSYAMFLQVLWPLATFACLVTLAIATQGFMRYRSASVVVYVLGISALLMAAVGDILSAWLSWADARIFNSETIALFASWMLVISVLEAQRVARQERKRAEQETQATHQRMSAIFDLAPSPMFSVDVNGKISTYNSSFKSLQKKIDSPEFLQPQFLADLWRQLHEQTSQWTAQYRHINTMLQACWYEMCLVANGKELIGSLRDITAEKDRESLLHFQATHDELTGALNRRGLDDRLKEHISNGRESIDLVLFDVVRFRNLVKAHGLTVADRILYNVYQLLYRYLCTHGDIVRIGYDQFLIVHSKRHQDTELKSSVNRLLDSVKTKALQVDGLQAFVQMRVGVMQMTLDPEEKSLLGLVEDLVNEMKFKFDQDINTLRVFNSEESHKLMQYALMGEHILAHGLPNNLTLCWQPILGVQNQKPCLYAEALLRQIDEQGRLVSAASVLTTCHNRGRTTLLDKWVIASTLEFLQSHEDKLGNLKTVGVNVSPLSLNDESFLNEVVSLLEAHSKAASKLCLEVTEVGTILNPASVKAFMMKIKNLGVTVGLDDFGAGFSNFQYVLDLQADVIKIDGSIASKVCANMESRSVVNAIVTLARDLGCVTVAEWVEDKYTLDELKELGVDYIQGFLISQAIPPEQFLAKESCAEFYSVA